MPPATSVGSDVALELVLEPELVDLGSLLLGSLVFDFLSLASVEEAIVAMVVGIELVLPAPEASGATP